MKKDIHPAFQKAIVHCACGNEFETFSTVYVLNVIPSLLASKKLSILRGVLKDSDVSTRMLRKIIRQAKRSNKRIIDYVPPN